MPLNIGSLPIDGCKFGTSDVTAIYVGSNKIWLVSSGGECCDFFGDGKQDLGA